MSPKLRSYTTKRCYYLYKQSYVDYHVSGIGMEDEARWEEMAKFHAEWSKRFYDVFVPLLREWDSK